MKALILAYSKANLGDDLFIQILCNRYPHVEFTILSAEKYSMAFDKIDNLNVKKLFKWHYRIDGILKRLKLNFRLTEYYNFLYAKKFDAVIHIGGSIFIQNSNWENKLFWYKKIIKASKNSFILGSNFGSYYTEEYKVEHNKLFKKFNDICFREEYSWRLFKDLDNTHFAPDIVFSLQTGEIQSVPKKKRIIISVINLKNRNNLVDYLNEYEDKLVSVINTLANNGFEIYLMNFCIAEGDDEASNRIYDKLNSIIKANVSKYNYEGNLSEALSIISKSDGIIATRFHAMILGWVFEKKVYPIVYSEKTINVIEDIDFKDSYSKISNIKNLNTNKLLKYFMKDYSFDISAEKEASELQFKGLDNFFYK